MARFFGKVGYATTSETSPGVWTSSYTEREYYGDVSRNIRRLDGNEPVNLNVALNNSFSILADAYAYDHMADIRYVEFMGVKWKVSAVEVQRPRLILSVTEEYDRVD